MKDLQQQQIISSGSKERVSRYTLDMPPPAAHISYKQEMVGTQYGWVKIISAEKRWNQKMNHCYVLTQCTGCNAVRWINLNSLTSGKSKGCQACSQKRIIPLWLYRRLSEAKQRCTNSMNRGYKNYGGRGIKFGFRSVTDAGLYLIKKFGLPSKEMELDRIDTNGDYAPGNLQFCTHLQNCINQRRNVLSDFKQEYWPYSRPVVTRMLSNGLSREQIIENARKAVLEKRKHWKIIDARLDFMTYSMPDHITVLRYRGTSSITADMGAEPVH